MDSRRTREELIRSRYVHSDIIFRIPDGATANDSHHRFSIYRIRVKEEDGWKNFFRKIATADFQGTTEFSVSGIYDKGRDYMQMQSQFPRTPGTAAPKQKDPGLPDNFSQITEAEGFRCLGLDESHLSIEDTSFSVQLNTADPEEVDTQINKIFDAIDEVYDG